MCERDQFEKDRLEYEARGFVTRRQFGALVGAGIAMMLPSVANAVAVTESDVTVAPPEIEVYAGAAHGWCPPDPQVYNEPQAEKAWSRLLALYGKALA
jgi:dienelactone hydrolase